MYDVVELKYSQSSYKKILSNLRESLIEYFVETIHEDIKEADGWYERIENIIKSKGDDFSCFEVRSEEDIIGFIIFKHINKNFALLRYFFVLDKVNREEVGFFLLKEAIGKLKQNNKLNKFNNAAFTFPEDYLANPLKRLGYSTLKRHNMTLNLSTFEETYELLAGYSFIPFNEKYLSELAKLCVNSFKNHPDTSFWEEVNSIPLFLEYLKESLTTYMLKDCSFIVKNNEEQIVGFCLIEKGYEERDIILQNLVVNESIRGKGIGTALLSYTLNITRKQGFKKAILTVSEGVPAQKIYERFGFKRYNSFNIIINL